MFFFSINSNEVKVHGTVNTHLRQLLVYFLSPTCEFCGIYVKCLISGFRIDDFNFLTNEELGFNMKLIKARSVAVWLLCTRIVSYSRGDKVVNYLY